MHLLLPRLQVRAEPPRQCGTQSFGAGALAISRLQFAPQADLFPDEGPFYLRALRLYQLSVKVARKIVGE